MLALTDVWPGTALGLQACSLLAQHQRGDQYLFSAAPGMPCNPCGYDQDEDEEGDEEDEDEEEESEEEELGPREMPDRTTRGRRLGQVLASFCQCRSDARHSQPVVSMIPVALICSQFSRFVRAAAHPCACLDNNY